ncbi:hypothetical protein ACFLV0_07535 [Chloroflexota bacterium]
MFKGLATIAAWILFIGGCLGLVSRMVAWFAEGFFGTGADMAEIALQFVFIAIWFVAAVVVMYLRQKMA